ncbi:flagellar hook capping FlgD N-terminal domain-containing protein [Tropicibacter oceani]|uniref:Basal-body rod modification protein FlgD n=1 Tax=Tropicibacter oceani TaxID=3058420 RepID=A0ABY8QJJ0_9RHOB|nr:flagellar hook capping FlgD N-terminal domain-containing protein [Tropicibacter oceani]WGW04675.1 flagellar hook capping FlgD N-terminal domain-containing protein [Tropicibacter oceani]
MVDVSSATSAAGIQTRVAASESKSDANAALSSDFDTFIRMLTVQVQNQDPLNPVDSTDYATQLATFSSVEQQVLTNDLLKEMAAQLGGAGLQQAGQWIGMEALARAPVWFNDSPISIRPEYPENADSAKLLVRNSSGDLVQTFDLNGLPEDVVWTGTDEEGALLPVDVYSFQIEHYEGQTLLATATPLSYNRIVEVRSDDNDIVVRLSDGTEIPSTMVTGLRTPTAG